VISIRGVAGEGKIRQVADIENGPGIERLLVRTRMVAWVMFFAGCLAAWYVLFVWSSHMQVGWLGFPGMTTQVSLDTATIQGGLVGQGDMLDMDRFLSLFAMWMVMMAAMMLPTFVPTARIFMDLVEAEIARPVGLAGLAVGYTGVWMGVAALLAAVQTGLVHIGLTGPTGQNMSPLFSAVLLIVAGLYQFTEAKDRCAHLCRSPMSMFLAEFRPGLRGGIGLGLKAGKYCAVCCWGLIALGFAGGMMSLLWMGLATVLMVLEKTPKIGRWLTAPIGIGLVALGLGVAGRGFLG